MERIREKIREREGAVESRERKSGQREREGMEIERGEGEREAAFSSFLPLSSLFPLVRQH